MHQKELYDSEYYHTSCGEIPYEEVEVWKAFFSKIADDIVDTLAPTTVLDVGCAMGYLVTALRDRGVEAYGIDVSKYAISCVRDDIKPFCFVSSALEELPKSMPKHYDLVTTIEVIEHLFEKDCELFLKNICSYSDDILFSSSPDDITEKTHFNVQQAEYWAKKMAQLGYYKDLEYDAGYIAPHSVRVTKKEIHKLDLVEYFEKHMRIEKSKLQSELNEVKLILNGQIEALSIVRDENDGTIRKISNENKIIEDRLSKLFHQNSDLNDCLVKSHYVNDDLKNKLSFKTLQYDVMSNSTCWKMTKPIRYTLDKLRKTIFFKGLLSLKKKGVKITFHKIVQKVKNINISKKVGIKSILAQSELEKQRITQFSQDIMFSIIVPLYNTPNIYLSEMIKSVQSQTYSNWELCLADGSSAEFKSVELSCLTYAQNDKRIKYKKLERNLGISGNTNESLQMATGDYIAMLDHDDLLHPAALYENMVAICENNADFIYTDELTFKKDISHPVVVHFKPDFAIDNLRANNYICHFTTFKHSLLNKVGEFSSECDGSQDHDMFLRLTQYAEHIVHIPKLLYYWRSHSGSVASGVAVKSYCVDAGIKAVSNHLKSVSLLGQVESVPDAGPIYRIKYELNEKPLISIVVYGNSDFVVKCVESIQNHTAYKNYEIIIKKTPEVKCCNGKNIIFVNTVGMKSSEMINYMSTFSNGEYLLFLDSVIRVVDLNWIDELLMYAQRADVGAVGTKIYNPDNTVYHAGILVNHGFVSWIYEGLENYNMGYMGRLMYTQNLSAVSACCMMISKENFEQVDGFDEELLTLYDVDLCLKLRAKEKLIVFTPYAVMRCCSNIRRMVALQQEKQHFTKKYSSVLDGYDPCYNPNFVEASNDFSLGHISHTP